MVNGAREIFVGSVAGGARQQITSTHLEASYPHWSPDGQTLMFGDQSAKSDFAISLMRRSASGSWDTKARVAGHGLEMAWSPKGDSVLVFERIGLVV